jgi:hypothetical protein
MRSGEREYGDMWVGEGGMGDGALEEVPSETTYPVLEFKSWVCPHDSFGEGTPKRALMGDVYAIQAEL